MAAICSFSWVCDELSIALFPVSLALLVLDLEGSLFDPSPTQAKVAQIPTGVRVN